MLTEKSFGFYDLTVKKQTKLVQYFHVNKKMTYTPLQKHWNSGANSSTPAAERKHLGLTSNNEHETRGQHGQVSKVLEHVTDRCFFLFVFLLFLNFLPCVLLH